MKHFVTLAALLMSIIALAQNPNYDPDSNGDGFIGAADLVTFLTVFDTMLTPETLTIGYVTELDSVGSFYRNDILTPYYSVPDSVDLLLYTPDTGNVEIEPCDLDLRWIVLRANERQRLTVRAAGFYSQSDTLVPVGCSGDNPLLLTWFHLEGRWYAH